MLTPTKQGIYWVVEHGKIAARGKNIIS